ncbi:MAG: diguanylate cyclase (GGDEF)-like protein/PAS domain S-box-containing protein [Paraglaciecola sp.]|jgi:diguanylate cyclase (GGDEF)-like protein/PAS domain S-box-containing protein
MRNNSITFLLAIIVLKALTFSAFAQAQELLIDQNMSRINLLPATQWLITDKKNQLSEVQNIQNWDFSYSPKPLAENTSLWARIDLEFTDTFSDSYFLTIGNPHLSYVDLYILDDKGRILSSFLMGANRAFSLRPYPHREFVIPVLPSQGAELKIFMKISDDGPLVFPLNLIKQNELIKSDQASLAAIGFISGAIVILGCYFLLTYMLLRSPIRFWFSVSCATYLLLFLNIQGLVSYLTEFSKYISNVSSVLIAVLLFTAAKVSFAILETVPAYFRYFVYSFALVMLGCAVTLASYEQTIAATILLISSVLLTILLSLFYQKRDKKLPNTVFAMGVLTITLSSLTQVTLFISGTPLNDFWSLILVMIATFGIVLIALAIEAHERVVTYRHHTKQQHTISNLQHFYDLFRNSAEGLYTSTLDGKLININPAMCILFGYENEQQMLAEVSDTTGFYAVPEDRELLLGEIHQNGVVLGKEIKGLRKDGAEFWFSISTQIKQQDDDKFVFGSIFDITERKQSNISLEYLATHDSLTGVYNRREFERRLNTALSDAQSQKSELTLLYMDLDQFKVVNDTCGHKAGDLLIKQLSQKLNDVVMHRGFLARLGGDEFGVLLEGDNAQMAYLLANKLLSAVGEFRFIWENRIFTLGISIGQVSWQDDIKTPEQLLSMADSACYVAKERGRNQVHTYSKQDEHMQRYTSELNWVSHINHALENNCFELHYQHYHSLSKATSGHHYEILLRMRDQDNKVVLPGVFLPAAERHNLTSQIDRWVIQYYFKWLAEHPEHKEQVTRCNINLSGHSLADKELKLFVLNAFEKHSIPYNKICFEISESMAIVKMDETLEFINLFQQLGCAFALDDFGSGFSSYGYLKNLPVDQIKIDGNFVKNILVDPIDMAMVCSIKDVVKAMGMETVAKFVESKEIMVALGRVGVDYAQGYGVAKPKPLDDFTPYQ